MAHTFSELVIGGVLLAPFVTYLVASSCRHHSPATASACRRLCEDVQSRLNCRAESRRDYSGPIDAVVLEEVAMDAAVR